MTTQAFTFREMCAIWKALDIVLRHGEQLSQVTKSMETAFEKVDRVIDETHYQQKPCNVYALAPLYIQALNKE